MANEMRLIDANALLEKMEHTSTDVCADYGDCFCLHGYSTQLFRLIVSETPTVDARPVVHGHWEDDESSGYYRCNRCKDVYIEKEWIEHGKWKYCPNCGSQMDGVMEMFYCERCGDSDCCERLDLKTEPVLCDECYKKALANGERKGDGDD